MSNCITEEEFTTLVRLAKKALWSDQTTRKRLQEHRINITPANFYSNIPLIDDINNSFEYRNRGEEIYNSGIFDARRMTQFMEIIGAYSHEFDPPKAGDEDDPAGFFWENPAFSYTDAMSYYCMLRHFKPERVLEIGSGFSTLVAHQALKMNGQGKLALIEPYPKAFLERLDTVDHIDQRFVQDIPVNELVTLVEDSDIWFIDSTHTVKTGSDCLYIYLLTMPAIKKDIIVHTHDVFLPYAPPKTKALEKHIYWTEQYLLYAYMLDNPKIEVLFGSAYAKEKIPDELSRLMGDKYPGGGGSIWYRLNGDRLHGRP